MFEECTKERVDYAAVEELLKQGADPLGGMAVSGWELLEHVYEELVYDSFDLSSNNLPKITELFLKYGMDVDHPRIPYDDDFSLNPLWSFTFVMSENATQALKMLLDHGLSMDSFAEFMDHTMSDLINLECGDPENDEYWNNTCTWAFKMLLLGASYDHIYQNDECIRKIICSSYNSSDIHIFRNWNEFEYHFDTSHCEKYPELYGSIVHIYSKQTGEEVWTIGVGKAGKDALEEALK